MTGWHQLPRELRWLIFDSITKDYTRKLDPLARVSYVTVCREWQLVFERETFSQLVLDQDRLQDLDNFVTNNERRRYSVKILFLRIKLEEYNCSVCESLEDDDTIKRNDQTFIESMWRLLSILSRWTGARFTLDLGVYCPSDAKHTFRDFRFAKGYPYIRGSVSEKKPDGRERAALALCETGDDCPGRTNARKGEPSYEAKRRSLSIVADPRSSHYTKLLKGRGRQRKRNFPVVEAVTELRIGRVYSRIISPGILKKILKDSLTNLERLRHEKWHDIDEASQSYFENEYAMLLFKGLPNTLQELFILEDFNEVFRPNEFPWRPYPIMAFSLASSSCRLRKLSAFFLIDADVFFFPRIWPNTGTWLEDLQERPHYPDLELLTLTTQISRLRRFKEKATEMLITAGVVALYRMPKLRFMKIWCIGETHCCLFRFKAADHLEITWKSTLRADLSLVFETWHWMVQDVRPHQTLFVNTVPIPRRSTRSYGDVLHGPELRHDVNDPVSGFSIILQNQQMWQRPHQ